MGGWRGKILRVNLTKGTSQTEALDPKLARAYVGGRGLGTKILYDEIDPTVDSLVSLYGAAGYMERECHDMYGIAFRGNADLRPILLYEGFVGHPLRKDYEKTREQPLVPYRDQ